MVKKKEKKKNPSNIFSPKEKKKEETQMGKWKGKQKERKKEKKNKRKGTCERGLLFRNVPGVGFTTGGLSWG